MKPDNVNIIGINYKITYVDNPVDVDIHRREALFGQIDYWTRTIRIYDPGTRPPEDIFETIIHEVLHGIGNALNLGINSEDNHEVLDVLALALTDTLVRNKWVELK